MPSRSFFQRLTWWQVGADNRHMRQSAESRGNFETFWVAEDVTNPDLKRLPWARIPDTTTRVR